jgi:hypothetical protein
LQVSTPMSINTTHCNILIHISLMRITATSIELKKLRAC